jgi:hypothetical protein
MKTASLAAALAIVTMTLAGCGSSATALGSDVPEVYRAQIERVLANPPSDFVTDVLSDYKVTDAEYRESRQRLKECMEEAAPGLHVLLPDEGGVSYGLVDEFLAHYDSEESAQLAADKAAETCGPKTSSDIEFIYLGLRDNPKGYPNFPAAVKACFEAYGVSDGAGMSEADFATLVMDESFVASTKDGQSCVADPLAQLKLIDG